MFMQDGLISKNSLFSYFDNTKARQIDASILTILILQDVLWGLSHWGNFIDYAFVASFVGNCHLYTVLNKSAKVPTHQARAFAIIARIFFVKKVLIDLHSKGPGFCLRQGKHILWAKARESPD